jgi:hypothetical protein
LLEVDRYHRLHRMRSAPAASSRSGPLRIELLSAYVDGVNAELGHRLSMFSAW